MGTIYADFMAGGKGLAPRRGRTAQGDTLAQHLRDIADDVEGVLNPGSGALRTGGVVPLPLLSDPSTGSSQLTGTGNTTWNVNIAAYECEVGGLKKAFAAAADFSIHASSYLTGFANGTSCIAAIVAKNVSGTITTVAVKGTPATTGTQVAPTDAEIQAAVGATNSWVKVGECILNRTGDTTVTEDQDNTKMEQMVYRNYTLKTVKG
jgi:hypothetical protein